MHLTATQPLVFTKSSGPSVHTATSLDKLMKSASVKSRPTLFSARITATCCARHHRKLTASELPICGWLSVSRVSVVLRRPSEFKTQ